MAPPEPKKGVKKTPAKGSKKKVGKKQDGKKTASKDDGLDFGPPLYSRGLFAVEGSLMCPLRSMMYGFGDAHPEDIRTDAVNLVEDMVVNYCSKIMRDAADQASLRGNKMQAEDILFLLRKEPRKFARCKELLSKNLEIKQLRKQFEDDENIQKR